MASYRWEAHRHELSSNRTTEVEGQAVIALPKREVLTTLFSTGMFPTVTQPPPVDQNTTGVTNTNLANGAAQTVQPQNSATAQNVLSPGATSYASQTQYAPVNTS